MLREDPKESYGLHGSLEADDVAHFRVVATRVEGPPAFAVQFGWDVPTRPWKPFLSFEVLGWALLIGWTHCFESPYAKHAGQVCERTMRRDYWIREDNGTLMHKGAVCKLHDPEADEPRPFLVDHMLHMAGIQDGDEFEILITPTGRRPHGDRLWVTDTKGTIRPETDLECLARIEVAAGNSSAVNQPT